jgi:hypothetical protein
MSAGAALPGEISAATAVLPAVMTRSVGSIAEFVAELQQTQSSSVIVMAKTPGFLPCPPTHLCHDRFHGEE